MITRRAMPLAFLPARLMGAKAVTLGISTQQFVKHTNQSLAQELRANSIRTIQLFLTQTDSNYWKYNAHPDMSSLTPAKCTEIAGTYMSAGVKIHSIGVYSNLIHPAETELKAGFTYFEAMMKIGAHMGVRTFITEAGHYRPPGPVPAVPFHFQEEVWNKMVSTGKELARMAAANGATVLLEPYFEGFLATAKRTRMFIEEVGAPQLRVNLDPANLLEVNDLEEMFGQLQPLIDCCHAKDRKLHVTRGVGAGMGDLDYRKFVKLVAERRPSAPLILEYVGPENYKPAFAQVRKAMREAGVQER